MNEVRLTAGRVTEEVVLIDNTVHRPAKPNSRFVRALLAHLEECEFEAAPRYLGSDDQGREVFSFKPGDVPAELSANISDHALASAARLIRRFHDATAGTDIAASGEVVCHNDLSPCNFVFRKGQPVAIIDFDAAAPGERLQDVGYALFLWLNLGTDGPSSREQARRIKLFCDAYGIEANDRVIGAIVGAVARNIEQLRVVGRLRDVEWWQAQLHWLNHHGRELASHERLP